MVRKLLHRDEEEEFALDFMADSEEEDAEDGTDNAEQGSQGNGENEDRNEDRDEDDEEPRSRNWPGQGKQRQQARQVDEDDEVGEDEGDDNGSRLTRTRFAGRSDDEAPVPQPSRGGGRYQNASPEGSDEEGAGYRNQQARPNLENANEDSDDGDRRFRADDDSEDEQQGNGGFYGSRGANRPSPGAGRRGWTA